MSLSDCSRTFQSLKVDSDKSADTLSIGVYIGVSGLYGCGGACKKHGIHVDSSLKASVLIRHQNIRLSIKYPLTHRNLL